MQSDSTTLPPHIAHFWAKVNKDGPIPAYPELGPCWLWTGKPDPGGYGRYYWLPDDRQRGAHCVSWIIAHGPIPKGLVICHRCDVRPCVRPSHLFLGTYRDNMQDMVRKERDGPRKHLREYAAMGDPACLSESWRAAILAEAAIAKRAIAMAKLFPPRTT